MLRLHANSLNSDWFEFLVGLFGDLEPLGHFARVENDGVLTIGTSNPIDRGSSRYENRWSDAHHLRHRLFLREHRDGGLYHRVLPLGALFRCEVFRSGGPNHHIALA